ncbi:hypothetical protein [Aequorivita antarctica]|uniref:DUF4465 domain-containing protein n=1 Tax=Aequorivita antarctica TaxID=153266 RepID=A0A5C6YY01_9FLAO|nr:hypothetical protein [Aequorivita antarctica]TXD72516.1 hypothetical protein ESU54_11930 [Aequorivita antarctica]SRX75390.1 hypothetical protein AEQU3_02384 [Aequorivita antarctica]
MKKPTLQKNIFFAIFCLIAMSSLAQVSISNGTPTATPKGLVDMQNSTAGIVYPRFALTSTEVEAPVQNPDGSGSLVAGTVVYNTNTTTTGLNDVFPGLYAWNGSKWTTQYIREDSDVAQQSGLGQRIVNSGGYVDVTGLGAGSSFTPKYSGTYRIKANVNFGAGEIVPKSGFATSMATEEGYFRITLGPDSYLIYTHAYSVHNNDIAGGTYFEQFRHDTSLIVYVDLVAGVPFTYRFEIDLFVSDNFVDNGNSGTGRAYVGIGLPCNIEFTYLVE